MVEGNCRWQVPLVLKNFRHFLGPDWNLYIFGTSANYKWIPEQLKGWKFGLALVDKPQINAGVFNNLYKGKNFWESLREEHILTIQADTICCQPLDPKWFEYAFVGAPCGKDTLNGGLSLRRNSYMKETLNRYGAFADNDRENEDVFFTKCLRLMGAPLPNGYDAAFFSVESYYYGLPFGVHGTDKGYHNIHVAQKIVDQIEL
jgi:hypothetical protein